MKIVFGRASDELFITFMQAKQENNFDLAQSVLDNLNSMSDDERQELSGLYMDVEDFLNDRDNEYELV